MSLSINQKIITLHAGFVDEYSALYCTYNHIMLSLNNDQLVENFKVLTGVLHTIVSHYTVSPAVSV